MSSALVRKGLELVDPESFKTKTGKKHKNVFHLIPENQKIIKKIKRKGGKTQKVNILQASKKLTVTEAKRKIKSKEEILKANLKKLKQIRQACTVELDKKVTEQIIERAVTRRPIRKKSEPKKKQQTLFTEEDFKRFAEEYQG